MAGGNLSPMCPLRAPVAMPGCAHTGWSRRCSGPWGRGPLIFPQGELSFSSTEVTLPRKTVMMASCSNHRLLKIAPLNKGKMWTTGPGFSGPGAAPLAAAWARLYHAPPENGPGPGAGRRAEAWPGECRTSPSPSQNLARQGSQAAWQLSWAGLQWNPKAPGGATWC